ncbi:hypothetical protein LINPERHAP2_LOCUS39836, partial [Linum perenne]
KGPSYYALRTTLLQDIKQECRLVVENLRNHWKEVGCTIMAYGWTDKRHRSLINFLVYCPMGTCFVKSVDSSGTVKTADNLFKMFASVIEWVGLKHVVHVVIDNASNYVKAGKKITQHYKNIYWNPCVAHTMNLIMKDICALPHVSTLAKKASKVTIFVYNHGPILHWLQQRSTWREIVRPGATRFATTFLSLSSIVDRQSDLQALMVDEFWKESPHSKTEIGKAVMSIVLDLQFWEDCKFMVKLTTPIVRLLRIVDSDTKPALGYVHEGMTRVEKVVKEICGNVEARYMCYTKILDERWDKHLNRDLIVGAYFFNPTFMYSEDFDNSRHVKHAMLNLIDNSLLCSDSTRALEELSLYKDRQGGFGRKIAMDGAKTQQPAKWWDWFGKDTPIIQNLAIRILSQTAASSGCERNWSVFERIHTKRRNMLEHKRLSDLVFVHYNMRLKHREYYNKKKDTYDPVDYASIGAASEWIVEGDGASPPPDLDIDSFEQDLAGEEGEPYVDVDFGLGLGGVSHEDTSTFGLP